VVAAIILWNTVYLERAIQALRDSGHDIDETLLLTCRAWLEHINLTGDYVWQQSKLVEQGGSDCCELVMGTKTRP